MTQLRDGGLVLLLLEFATHFDVGSDYVAWRGASVAIAIDARRSVSAKISLVFPTLALSYRTSKTASHQIRSLDASYQIISRNRHLSFLSPVLFQACVRGGPWNVATRVKPIHTIPIRHNKTRPSWCRDVTKRWHPCRSSWQYGPGMHRPLL